MAFDSTFWTAIGAVAAVVAALVALLALRQSKTDHALKNELAVLVGRIDHFLRVRVPQLMPHVVNLNLQRDFAELIQVLEEMRQKKFRMTAKQAAAFDAFFGACEQEMSVFVRSMDAVVASSGPTERDRASEEVNRIFENVRTRIAERGRLLLSTF